jgi:Protein kinase domain/PASTA domain
MTSGDDGPRTVGGRYVLGERLAAGEGREVWHAHDDVVGRLVALKIFFGEQAADPTWRDAFRHDAERLAALSRPGIAKVYEHGESDDETWLAMAFVDGEPLSTKLAAAPSVSAAEGLDIIGQTALALSAAHNAGIVHGDLTPANLLIRDDGVVSVVGFAVASGATRADDLRALGTLADDCLRGAIATTPDLSADVHDFLSWLTNPDRPNPPTDAAEIGRTALALAASVSGSHKTTVVPSATAPTAMDDTAGAEPRYDEAERRRVRNRLIILAAIVVIGGAALLRFIGEGGGDVTVPSVVGLPLSQAQLNLTTAGLRNSEKVTVGSQDSGGTVASQSPTAGQEVKAGSTVTLTLSEGSP